MFGLGDAAKCNKMCINSGKDSDGVKRYCACNKMEDKRVRKLDRLYENRTMCNIISDSETNGMNFR